MSNDVKRAYFYAPASRPIYIKIPDEDWEAGDEGKVGVLNLSLYGTRDAAMNWADTYSRHLKEIGFMVGRGSPCNFYHPTRGIAMTVHGDDFTSTGTEADLRWLDAQLKSKYELKTKYLGPTPHKGHLQELRILNRVISWTDRGITYEADPRHAELLVQELQLDGAKGVTTPGSKDDVSKAAAENEASDDTLLSTSQTTRYRGIAARLNFLAQDRPDLLYASKEASRRMSGPRQGDWGLLKRIGRYLIRVPRMQQTFEWQIMPDMLRAYVDSDWAGCKTTAKSTSGGLVCLGSHMLKAWSSTQNVIALSSGEAELYALVKGASQTLGLIAMADDFGISLGGRVHTDSSAAVGITTRQGLGKLRHIRVQYLWVQDVIKEKRLGVQKVPGVDNPSDVLTKHLDASTMSRHLTTLGFNDAKGRAHTAPTLSYFGCGILTGASCALMVSGAPWLVPPDDGSQPETPLGVFGLGLGSTIPVRVVCPVNDRCAVHDATQQRELQRSEGLLCSSTKPQMRVNTATRAALPMAPELHYGNHGSDSRKLLFGVGPPVGDFSDNQLSESSPWGGTQGQLGKR